jgi:hypothetical protein
MGKTQDFLKEDRRQVAAGGRKGLPPTKALMSGGCYTSSVKAAITLTA